MNEAKARNPSPALCAIAIGVEGVSMRLLRQNLPDVEFREAKLDIQELLKNKGDTMPDLIFCGSLMGNADIVELAQAIRSVWADPPMYFISTKRDGFDQSAFRKNGFADAFLLPMDNGFLRGIAPDGSNEYRDVPLIELQAGTVLDFDTYVFLPLNRKFVRFSSSGYALEQSRAKRLMEHEVRSVYVSQEQVPSFVKFTAEQLKKISLGEGMSAGERRKQMRTAVRALVTGFLAENAETADYAAIIKTYIVDASPEHPSMYERMLNMTSGEDAYSHVSNVSALGALLALGLEVGNIEEVALAGLLHDIGLADIDAENLEKEESDRSERERQAYQEHPRLALQILQKKQIELSTIVLKAIEQHHERWDGAGYPNGISGQAFLPESQVLAIADELDEAMQVKPGRTRVSLKSVLDSILASPAYSPDLLQKLAELLDVPKAG